MHKGLRRRTLAALATLSALFTLVVVAPSCASVLGIEEPELRRDAGFEANDDSGREEGDGSVRDADSSSTAVDAEVADTGQDAGQDSGPPTGTCNARCVPAPPAGWLGPFAYSVATGGAPQPSSPPCASPYGATAGDYTRDLNAPAAVCGCACGAPSGVACTAQVTLYSDGACTTVCSTPDQPIAATCTPLVLAGCPSKPKGKATVSAPTGGSCAPQPSGSIPSKSWGTAVRLCGVTAPASGTCSTGVCAPLPSLPQTTGALCIAATGDKQCPTSYPARQVVYTGASDTRDCSTCSCGTPSGASCTTPTVTGYDNVPACSGATHPLASCTTAGDGAKVVTPSTPTGGQCLASGGQPLGTATAENPTTICCLE